MTWPTWYWALLVLAMALVLGGFHEEWGEWSLLIGSLLLLALCFIGAGMEDAAAR